MWSPKPEGGPQLAERGAESPARPVPVIEAVADDDAAAIVDRIHELAASGTHGSEAMTELGVGELLDLRGEVVTQLEHGRDAVARHLDRLVGEEDAAVLEEGDHAPGDRHFGGWWIPGNAEHRDADACQPACDLAEFHGA